MNDLSSYDDIQCRYFKKPGPKNAKGVMEAVSRRAGELNIEKVLIATNTGRTALEALEVLGKEIKIIVTFNPDSRVTSARSIVLLNKLKEISKVNKSSPSLEELREGLSSKEQLIETVEFVKNAGASIIRGGAFKPRTSPYSFQGLEKKGLELLANVREETGLPVITEVMSTILPFFRFHLEMDGCKENRKLLMGR